VLPTDGHVHSEWSWDATEGSMERTCVSALKLGLSGIAFTEHADFGGWAVLASDLGDYPHLRRFVVEDSSSGGPVGGTLRPPPLNAAGYLAAVERCREQFPLFRILSGVEIGEPHWHRDAVTALLKSGRFDRVIGSLHCLKADGETSEMPNLFRQCEPAEVVHDYLAELVRLIEGSDRFEVLGHIDYVVRYWPDRAAPFAVAEFEDEFRHVLRTLAGGERVLELNTRGPALPEMVRWWREEGGRALSFGSDAHAPSGVGRAFPEAAIVARTEGFQQRDSATGFWFVGG
jgi:histidinol-phosphatase (PHP family)